MTMFPSPMTSRMEALDGAALRKQPTPWPNPRKGSDMDDATIARFWSKVDKLGDGPYDCWDWTGAVYNGYGSFYSGPRRSARAHRFAYELLIGPIPAGLVIDHLCRNTRCVNPAHLEAVTDRVNALRGVSSPAENARKTQCERGHEFTPENTYRYNGKRWCRPCGLIRDRKYHGRSRPTDMKEL